ncbi:hypothetical protein MKW98_019987 [Papaver atlanticum]|uniref:Uncharacterized protein n=1 Tax=Papaver atlanticum TaxID=357466 RepID=A0AAD4X7A2_9MAGN|nr:hypothetical protein MKW98_019987 [Papaver atlanticum]
METTEGEIHLDLSTQPSTECLNGMTYTGVPRTRNPTPQYSNRPQGNRLDQPEFSELVKRESTTEDLDAGQAGAAQVQGLGFARCGVIATWAAMAYERILSVASNR